MAEAQADIGQPIVAYNNITTTPMVVCRILKRGVTITCRKGSTRGRVREGDVPPPHAKHGSPAVQYHLKTLVITCIPLRNQQDSTFS